MLQVNEPERAPEGAVTFQSPPRPRVVRERVAQLAQLALRRPIGRRLRPPMRPSPTSSWYQAKRGEKS
jgi:hypothetical protein